MRERAADAGIALVPAVEMTTRWENRQVHVLVYGVELGAKRTRTFEAVMRRQQEQLRVTAERAAALIERHGRRIPSLDAVAMGLPLRPHHVFTAMIRDGHASSLKHAHDIVRALGEPVVVDVPLAETVHAAHEAGAVAIVAHPGRDEGMGILDDGALDRMLAEIPIDGVEAHYRSYKDEDTARYRAWAARRGLLVSAGSDSHWPNHPVNPRPHPARWIADLLDRLGYEVAPFDGAAWEPVGETSEPGVGERGQETTGELVSAGVSKTSGE
jgi:predicted metal-dependent phosphoesterase TrpH